MNKRKIRILMAKPGMDGHDRGVKVVARALRDAGFEVIYTGIHQTPEEIANAAIQENVDFVGLSLLSGAHRGLFPEVVDQIRKKGNDSIIVFGGGVIPNQDIDFLKANGIKEVFTPGSSTDDMVKFIQNNSLSSMG